MLANGAAAEKRNRLDGGARQARRGRMAKPPSVDPKPPAPAVKGDAARDQRLAEALRANLRRRKAAGRVSAPQGRAEKD